MLLGKKKLVVCKGLVTVEEAEIDRIITKADNILKAGEDFLMATADNKTDYESMMVWARCNYVDINYISRKIAVAIGLIVKML